MDLSRLTPDQRKRLAAALAEQREFWARLRRRLAATKWGASDPLWQLADAGFAVAHAAVNLVVDPRVPDRSADPPPECELPRPPFAMPPGAAKPDPDAYPDVPVAKRPARRRR